MYVCVRVEKRGTDTKTQDVLLLTHLKNLRKGPFVSVVPINYSLTKKKAGKQANFQMLKVQEMEMN